MHVEYAGDLWLALAPSSCPFLLFPWARSADVMLVMEVSSCDPKITYMNIEATDWMWEVSNIMDQLHFLSSVYPWLLITGGK